MPSYRPPFARMNQIKRDAPQRPQLPKNVEEAIAVAVAEHAESESDAPEIRVSVGDVEAVVTPGPDEVFGTDDDHVTLEAVEPEPEPEPDEPLIAEPETPEYGMEMRKSDLVDLAGQVGVSSEGTKADIVAALDAHFGQ